MTPWKDTDDSYRDYTPTAWNESAQKYTKLLRNLEPYGFRSEEGRGGEEGRCRGAPHHLKKKKKPDRGGILHRRPEPDRTRAGVRWRPRGPRRTDSPGLVKRGYSRPRPLFQALHDYSVS